MEGNGLPVNNSREAPPPLETCENLSKQLNWLIAATESPPPTIVITLFSVALPIRLAKLSVPWWNPSVSNKG